MPRKRKRKKITRKKNSLSYNLRALRVDRKLNRPQLAERAGVAFMTVQFIEQGAVKDPKVSTVVKLAKVLEVRVGQLLGLERLMD
jgi:transcriptional regulator with XRE-family HTH domain